MYDLKKEKKLRSILLSLLVTLMMLGVLASRSEVVAQDHFVLNEFVKNIVAAQHRPAEVARLVQATISAHPQQAAVVAQAASKAVPPLTVLLTAAAVHTAPHRAAEIWQAVSLVASDQTSQVQTSADLAVSLAMNPNQSSVIIQSELVTQPQLASTIVAASVTACDILGGCARTPVQSIVSSAVAVDREAAESIVETAVYLMPSKSGAIIAAADTALQQRQSTSPSRKASGAGAALGATTRGAPEVPPVRVPGSTFR